MNAMMEPFTTLSSVVIPLDRANVDTDAILPKQFMKSVLRTGFGDNLFDEWRYFDHGQPGQQVTLRKRNPDFPLNQARYANGQILLTRDNFGCGSSREHAVWALKDFGIRVIVAPSFADIFYFNCFKNGLLPIRTTSQEVDELFSLATGETPLELRVDLPAQLLGVPGKESLHFDVDPSRKQRLILGLDDIGVTLQRVARIRAFEESLRQAEPWLFPA